MANTDKELQIFKDMLHTSNAYYQNKIVELEKDFEKTIKGFQILVEDQKALIVKQSKSLEYYERKYGRIIKEQ